MLVGVVEAKVVGGGQHGGHHVGGGGVGVDRLTEAVEAIRLRTGGDRVAGQRQRRVGDAEVGRHDERHGGAHHRVPDRVPTVRRSDEGDRGVGHEHVVQRHGVRAGGPQAQGVQVGSMRSPAVLNGMAQCSTDGPSGASSHRMLVTSTSPTSQPLAGPLRAETT